MELHYDMENLELENDEKAHNNNYYVEPVNDLLFSLSCINNKCFTPYKIICDFVDNIPYDIFETNFLKFRKRDNRLGMYEFRNYIFNKSFIFDILNNILYKNCDCNYGCINNCECECHDDIDKGYIDNYIYFLTTSFMELLH